MQVPDYNIRTMQNIGALFGCIDSALGRHMMSLPAQ